MYVTISAQKLEGSYPQSVSGYVAYLEKENEPLVVETEGDTMIKVGDSVQVIKNSGITANYLLEECLNQLGYINLDELTEKDLIKSVSLKEFKSPKETRTAISDTIRSVVSSREFQLA